MFVRQLQINQKTKKQKSEYYFWIEIWFDEIAIL